jgi:hypothetical protein
VTAGLKSVTKGWSGHCRPRASTYVRVEAPGRGYANGGPSSKNMHLSIDTVLPADSVEFCPHPYASNIFVCGTYKLQEEQNPSPPSSGLANASQNQIRTGQCLVFEVDSEQEIISACVS